MKAVIAFLVLLCGLAVSHAWNCAEAPQLSGVKQIDAGSGQVVATTSSYYGYFLSGKSWCRMGSYRFKHMTVGPAGMWGTDYRNIMYKLVAGKFRRVTSSMMQVDAGGRGQIVGTSTSLYAYCLRKGYAIWYTGKGSTSWSYLRKRLRYISCSPYSGCWATDRYYRIYYTRYVTPSSCKVHGWRQISGRAKVIEVGNDGSVFVVNKAGIVYQRTGISGSYPYGRSWKKIFVCVKARHVSYDLGHLWVVGTGGSILDCTR